MRTSSSPPRSDLSDMKSMQVISDLFDSLRNPDFIKNVCRSMSYMDATLFLPTFRSNVYYAYACPKYSFSTSHNTLYSSLLKIKYPKYSFALYISPLYLCITKPDHHIIYSTDEEVFINRILNGGAHGTVRALRGRVRDDRHIGLRPRRQDMYLLIRDVFFHNR